jgi:hypothetical protein
MRGAWRRCAFLHGAISNRRLNKDHLQHPKIFNLRARHTPGRVRRAFPGTVQAASLFVRFAGIENPGPVTKRDIDSFLAQSRTKLDRKFVQHGFDVLIGQMA